MEADILAAGHSLLDDKVGTGDKVAQLAEGFGKHAAVVELLGLTEDEVEPVEGAAQTQVAADYTNIVCHDFLQLFLCLGDEYHLLIEHHALGIPVGDCVVNSELRILNSADGIHGGIVGIDHGLEQRIAGQPVAAMQSCTRAFARGIEVVD